MTFKSNRDKFGPMFEAVADECGFDITHSPCKCGALGCGYADPMTSAAFAGFMLCFRAIDNKGGKIISPEPIPGITGEKIRIMRDES